MLFTLILAIHVLVLDPLLMFGLVKAVKKSKLAEIRLATYKNIDKVQEFFLMLRPVLQCCYKVIDTMKKKTGRPPTNLHFQFNVFIFWKVFCPGPIRTVIETVNTSPELQEVLGAPKKPYTESSFYRFKNKLSARPVHTMVLIMLTICFKEGIIKKTKAVIDSFPLYSKLNTQKCLKRPFINKLLVKQFFTVLDLSKVLALLPPLKKNAVSYEDKLKCWFFMLIWDFPTERSCHKAIFGKESYKDYLTLQKTWSSPATLKNFISQISKLEQFPCIAQELLTACNMAWQTLGYTKLVRPVQTLADLAATFHSPHRWKDPSVTFNYCSTKDEHFFGRGALVLGDPESMTPVLLTVTPRYKQSTQEIKTHLAQAKQELQNYFKGLEIFGDKEFGVDELIEFILTELEGFAVVAPYGNSSEQVQLSDEDKATRKLVETMIARLVQQYDIERPKCLGTPNVEAFIEQIHLCDLMVTYFNFKNGTKVGLHSIKHLRD